MSQAHTHVLACMRADRRLVVTRSAHVQPAHAATMVAHADAGRGPQPRWWRSPRGVARHKPIRSAICCRPASGWRALRPSADIPVSRHMLRGGVGCSHDGGAAQPQPRWWRDPCGGSLSATSSSKPPSPKIGSTCRQSMLQQADGSGPRRRCAAVQAEMGMASPEAWDRVMAMGQGQDERGHQRGWSPSPLLPSIPARRGREGADPLCACMLARPRPTPASPSPHRR